MNTSMSSRSGHDPAMYCQYRCSACFEQFITKTGLEHHVLIFHSGEANDCDTKPEVLPAAVVQQIFKCEVCLLNFSPKTKLAEHILQTHSDSHVCCGFIFMNKASRNKHNCVRSDTTLNDARQGTIIDFSESRKKPEKSSFVLNDVHIQEPTRKSSKQTAANEEAKSARRFPCSFCDLSFAMRVQLNGHVGRMHMHRKEQKKSWLCDICNTEFKKETEQQIHLLVAHGETNPYKCSICDSRFKMRNNLQDHMKIVHSKTNTNVKSYFCHCGQQFPSDEERRNHSKTHKERKLFKCSFCLCTFYTKASCEVHVNTQHYSRKAEPTSEPKPTRKNKFQVLFLCSVCNVGFPTALDLKTHSTSHVKT